jgi:hypothetical protein
MTRFAAALTFLVSSLTFGADVAGHYYLRGVMEVGSELQLNSDGTFEYMLAYGAADYFAKGTWKQDKDSVVLTTAGKEEPPFRVVKTSSEKVPGVRVWVQAPNGHPVEHIEVILNTGDGVLKQSTSSEGVALFGDARAAKSVRLNVRVYAVEAGPFAIEAGRNDIHFEINGEAIMRVPFKDEHLKIAGKSLEMRFWDKDRAMKYEKE